MPVIDLNSPDLWSKITEALDASNEHVCVLPMTTLIKPVRAITVLQTDTSVTAAKTECPPGSVNLNTAPAPAPAAPPAPEPEPEVEVQPEPAPAPAPAPTPEQKPEPADPRIVPYSEMQAIVSKWAFDGVINEAYKRASDLDVRSPSFGVINKGTLTVGMDWRDNPAQSVIVQVDIETGKLLAHKRGSTRYYFKVNLVEGTKFEFVGQSGKDVIDVAAFATP
ncbi:MAG: hypothetical protein H6713_36965 [Myxococcales bacterium]|nr:hypothetical protein [Myxococcales bacterium]